ncbi:PLC-like phosphodiesterase [Schizophyllum commune H4-8]|uniref:PLC-like phosphodiesterase n=1 Tax=Schizophyllum commune (strain H4-8 / FGSC 9210) TaxID=578458 RepID=UPI00215E87E5|nr:PLC-like phosphodiesterase [Schizophyllum commune H4-8]KAI5884883.1 PLC-like phosphodiesterase [Schizophyllum commune H4-8]
MSQPDRAPTLAGRALRRASNLLAPNGQPVMRELVDTQSPAPRKVGRGRITDSIRRKYKEVRDHKYMRRVRSSSSAVTPVEPPQPPKRSASADVALIGTPQHSDPPAPAPTSDVVVPQMLKDGTPMDKVTNKKRKRVIFRVDADIGHIVWEGRIHRFIPIENIKEIRTGADARLHRQHFQLSEEYENRWLTIIYVLAGNYKTLHLIAPTHDAFTMWDRTLRQLHTIRAALMTGLDHGEMRQAVWERQYWTRADEQRDHVLVFEEVQKLCRQLNINSASEDLQRLFKQADRQGRNYLDFDDFRFFVKLLKARPEVERLYKKLAAGGAFDFETFAKFMREEQESTLTEVELRAIYDKHTAQTSPTTPPSDSPGSPPCLTLDAFTNFLMSSDNAALDDGSTHDMTRPLSEYYISSSHNTYLVGHQLVGVSTVEGYIRALLSGCRSVEVDIYDGPTPSSEPLIFHGKTLVSKVPLRSVCAAIAKYGFVASPYPLIISAEMHCSVLGQVQVARVMIEEFGDTLVRVPLEDVPEDGWKVDHLPSPEELRGKILLKSKNVYVGQSRNPDAPPDLELTSTTTSESDFLEAAGISEYASTVKDFSKGILQRVRTRRSNSSAARTSAASAPAALNGAISSSPPSMHWRNSSMSRRQSENSTTTTPAKPKMARELLALLVYTMGVKCRGLNKKETYEPSHMFSLSENRANKMLLKTPTGMLDLAKHCRDHLVRVYPRGTRVSSSNFPAEAVVRYWCAGAQVVAINWQTFDLTYMLNHAMFQRNGRRGYVLKPSPLRAPTRDLFANTAGRIFDVEIISAQQLPRAKDATGREILGIVDPYVEVSIHVPEWHLLQRAPGSGSGRDSPFESGEPAAKRVFVRTGTVRANGFNPVWEQRLLIPFSVAGGEDMYDLIFVRFEVKQEAGTADEDDMPLAVYCSSLGALARGYRHLPLHDAHLSQYLFSTLFVRIGVRDA